MDWWSFGILIYELLYGFTPFRGKKRDETFNNILKRPLSFPELPEVSDECKVRISQAAAQYPDPPEELFPGVTVTVSLLFIAVFGNRYFCREAQPCLVGTGF